MSWTNFLMGIQWWCLFFDQTNHIWLFLCVICMYMHYTPLFGANSVVTVIMSSKDQILQMYDMVITRYNFSVRIQS
jgi:hypothetical protein